MLKKLLACASALLVTASLSSAVLGVSADEPLLRNGGLEELNDDGTTTGWDVWPGNPNEGIKQASVSTEIKHSGENSLCIELTPKNNQAVYQYTLAADNRFDFSKAYTFSAWVKLDNVTATDADGIRIGVNRKGADGNGYDLRESIELGTYDWTKISITVPKALFPLVQYDVIIDIGRGEGKIYMDDFELVEATDATTMPQITTTTAADDPTTAAPGDDTTAAPGEDVTTLAPEDTTAPSEETQGTADASGSRTQTTRDTAAGNTTAPSGGDGDDGFNVLPLVIVLAVLVAAGAVAVAVLIIRKRKMDGMNGPDGPEGGSSEAIDDSTDSSDQK
ncbi:MAG TPA: carbohydrate binding domain-containing protein [Firmicutes bacterium]|nr:carbohydrate binding domain-containing protein [Bacillota bacterium]